LGYGYLRAWRIEGRLTRVMGVAGRKEGEGGHVTCDKIR
jgi:hypothetical protein